MRIGFTYRPTIKSTQRKSQTPTLNNMEGFIWRGIATLTWTHPICIIYGMPC